MAVTDSAGISQSDGLGAGGRVREGISPWISPDDGPWWGVGVEVVVEVDVR